MSVFTEIDRRLRHSMLSRAQPFIRARAPWLHQALIVARDAVLPYESRFGLARYQHRALERFSTFAPDLSGGVLEVGSDVNGGALQEMASRGVKHLVGANIDVRPESHRGRGLGGAPHYEIVQGDVRSLPFADNTFSSIFSITAFEHVHNMDVALHEMHRVLKPGGLLYSEFGPIWSCSIGHHVEAMVDGVEARHERPGRNPVPHFAHLLMSPEQTRDAVLRTRWVFPALADAIVDWIYRGPGVNRVFYEDYVRLFERSPLTVHHLAPVREHVPHALQERLEHSCPGYRDFSVRMVEVVMVKP
jgi:SAM-dependent methyltransferase